MTHRHEHSRSKGGSSLGELRLHSLLIVYSFPTRYLCIVSLSISDMGDKLVRMSLSAFKGLEQRTDELCMIC